MPTAIRPSARRSSGDGSNLATNIIRILRGPAPAPPPGTTTIGRATDNDIVIPDVLASRHHATLVPSPEGVKILDARSINGTFVNGTRVDKALLREGDVVTIGNVDLMFHNGTLVRRTETEAATRTGGLEVRHISLTIEHGRTLLNNISFSARPGTLTAVIGPSGAGKSTLAKVIVGTDDPTRGKVSFEGHDIHGEYASLRSRIGMVPQDDVVHRQLTVDQALGYAAELRLPPDTTKQDRRQVMAQVLDELELTPHAQTRVDRLSGGQRKRASVAMELLTGPSLLILDEPTSGLDPALDRQVMTMLRQLADAGRVVVVVTHSLTYLDVCDQVLLLAPGGKTAFCGPPSGIGAGDGHDELGRHLHEGRRRSRCGESAVPGAGQPAAGAAGDGEAVRLGQAGAYEPAAAVLHNRSPAGAARHVGPRLLRVPGAAAVHRRCAVARRAWDRGLRYTQPDGRRAQRADPDSGAADHGCGLHGDRAHDSGPDRRAGDLPPRAGGGVVDDGVPAGQDLGVLHRGDHPVGDPGGDRCVRQRRPHTGRCGGRQRERRPVPECRGNLPSLGRYSG